MGGLLCAEVALIPSLADGSLKHRLIGTVNFDVPFLGMHPRVVKSGLASIFSPAPGPSKSPESNNYTPSVAGTQAAEGYFDDVLSRGASGSQAKGSPSPFSPSQTDPNYNPAFRNDVILPVRKGWEGAWYFLNKHSSDLRTATKQLVKSHIEFGGVMADYSGLKLRYARIRCLEEQNPNTRRSVVGSSVAPPRVRFVNYYTSATGRPPKQKTPTPPATVVETPSITVETTSTNQERTNDKDEKVSMVSSEEFNPRDDVLLETDDDIKEFEAAEKAERDILDHLEPAPMSEKGEDTSDIESWVDATENLEIASSDHTATEGPRSNSLTPLDSNVDIDAGQSASTPGVPLSKVQSLPPIPDPPTKPERPPFFSDRDSRKMAEKEYEGALKLYFKALKTREKALRDREKLEEKRRRQAIKDEKKAEKEFLKNSKNKEKEVKTEEKGRNKAIERRQTDQEQAVAAEQRSAQKEWRDALGHTWNDDDSTITPRSEWGLSKQFAGLSLQETNSSLNEKDKPFKDRTFCVLPPKDGSGIRDPTWARVLMKDVDLVGAHCGLFFPTGTDDRYEKLVGDVGERICQWVGEAESERVARELEMES